MTTFERLIKKILNEIEERKVELEQIKLEAENNSLKEIEILEESNNN